MMMATHAAYFLRAFCTSGLSRNSMKLSDSSSGSRSEVKFLPSMCSKQLTFERQEMALLGCQEAYLQETATHASFDLLEEDGLLVVLPEASLVAPRDILRS
jgi:hypothetical protein